MNLSDIYCQDRAIDNLQRAYGCGKVGHAYIFAAPDGVGRFTTAKAWGKLLLCQKPVITDGFADSCNNCPSCEVFDGDSHPDFCHIHKELIRFTKKTENKNKTPIDLPIDVIREFLIEKVATRPSLSGAKVYVVSESEKLNVNSQNALLKVLEEPPRYCYIILLCSKLENLLPTTQSRCQVVRFGAIDTDKIAAVLCDGGTGGDESKFWPRFTGGSVGQSLRFANLIDIKEESSACLYQFKRQLVEKLARFVLADVVDLAGWICASTKVVSEWWAKQQPDMSKKDITRQSQKTFIRIIVSVFSDVMKAEIADSADFVNFDQASSVMALARQFEAEEAAGKIEDCYEAIRRVDASVNEKLIFEHLLINLASSDTMRVSG